VNGGNYIIPSDSDVMDDLAPVGNPSDYHLCEPCAENGHAWCFSGEEVQQGFCFDPDQSMEDIDYPCQGEWIHADIEPGTSCEENDPWPNPAGVQGNQDDYPDTNDYPDYIDDPNEHLIPVDPVRGLSFTFHQSGIDRVDAHLRVEAASRLSPMPIPQRSNDKMGSLRIRLDCNKAVMVYLKTFNGQKEETSKDLASSSNYHAAGLLQPVIARNAPEEIDYEELIKGNAHVRFVKEEETNKKMKMEQKQRQSSPLSDDAIDRLYYEEEEDELEPYSWCEYDITYFVPGSSIEPTPRPAPIDAFDILAQNIP